MVCKGKLVSLAQPVMMDRPDRKGYQDYEETQDFEEIGDLMDLTE